MDTATLILRGAKVRRDELRAELLELDAIIGGGDTADDRGPRLKKLHWTQRPENQEKLRSMHRKARKARKAAKR